MKRGYGQLTKRLDAVEAENDRLREALEPLLTTAKLLFANSVGCLYQHHDHNPAHSLPGWLADAEKDILAAAALAKEEGQ